MALPKPESPAETPGFFLSGNIVLQEGIVPVRGPHGPPLGLFAASYFENFALRCIPHYISRKDVRARPKK
jgi:hypothetical protein